MILPPPNSGASSSSSTTPPGSSVLLSSLSISPDKAGNPLLPGTLPLSPKVLNPLKSASGQWLNARVIEVTNFSRAESKSASLATSPSPALPDAVSVSNKTQQSLWQAVLALKNTLQHQNAEVLIKVLSERPLKLHQALEVRLSPQQHLEVRPSPIPSSSQNTVPANQQILSLSKQSLLLQHAFPNNQLLNALNHHTINKRPLLQAISQQFNQQSLPIKDTTVLQQTLKDYIKNNTANIAPAAPHRKSPGPVTHTPNTLQKPILPTKPMQAGRPQVEGHVLNTTNTDTKPSSPPKSSTYQELLKQLIQQLHVMQSTHPTPQTATSSSKKLPGPLQGIEKLLLPLLKKASAPITYHAEHKKSVNNSLENALLQMAKQALARSLVQQATMQLAQSSSQPTDNNTFIHLDIPIRYNDQHSHIELIIQEQESEEVHRKRERGKQWQVFLEFDLPRLGVIQSHIIQVNEKTSVEFWSDSKTARRIIEKKLDNLSDTLINNGIDLERLTCKAGRINKQAFQMQYQILDITT